MWGAVTLVSVSSLLDLPAWESEIATRPVDWVEEARSRATGLVLTQPDGSLSSSRAGLRCNRIQLDAMRNRANQPGFLFGLWLTGPGSELPLLDSDLFTENLQSSDMEVTRGGLRIISLGFA